MREAKNLSTQIRSLFALWKLQAKDINHVIDTLWRTQGEAKTQALMA
jgi:hypothetical protein